jgi:hypothetical protein
MTFNAERIFDSTAQDNITKYADSWALVWDSQIRQINPSQCKLSDFIQVADHLV